jgi:integrase/recombinase XerC
MPNTAYATSHQPGLPSAWEEVWTDYEILKRSGLSERTLANYRDTLVQLAKFLGPAAPTMDSVTRKQVAAFIEYVTQTTSATTAAMRWRGLSAVFGFLARADEDGEAFLERNPVKGLKAPKTDEAPVPVLALSDAKKLIEACKGPSLEDRRDEAMIRFLFDTGVRRGELASMQVDPAWLNLKTGTAMVTGKTGPRIVSFGPRTGAAVLRYLRLRQRSRRAKLPALWISSKGALRGNGIYQALARRFELAGVDATKRAHVFRHTFAHEWQKAGGNVSDLMALAGWKSPAMALRYGKSAAAERARDAHKRLSPGERL